MIDERIIKVSIIEVNNKKNKCYSIRIPSIWARRLEIGENDRTLKLEFDGEEITLKKINVAQS